VNRYWLFRDQLLTGLQLKEAGLSRLRAADLGRCETVEEAQARARNWLAARDWQEAWVVAHNVRLACDSGRGARWGLSDDQLRRLRAGETLRFADSLGEFSMGYSQAN